MKCRVARAGQNIIVLGDCIGIYPIRGIGRPRRIQYIAKNDISERFVEPTEVANNDEQHKTIRFSLRRILNSTIPISTMWVRYQGVA